MIVKVKKDYHNNFFNICTVPSHDNLSAPPRGAALAGATGSTVQAAAMVNEERHPENTRTAETASTFANGTHF